MIRNHLLKILIILFVGNVYAFDVKKDSTVANKLVNEGNNYNKAQNYEQAIIKYIEAANLLEKLKDSNKLATVYTNIGVVNARLKNFDRAIKYLEKALGFISNNQPLKLRTLYNIAGLYYDKKDFKVSLSKIKDAEILALKLNNKRILSAIHSTYCNIYRDLKEYEKSINYGIKSLHLKEELKLNPDITINNIGYSYLLSNNNDKAIEYLTQVENTSNKQLQALVFNNLKNAYQNTNNNYKALAYATKLLNLKDSLTAAQQKVKVASLVEKYESEKKQQQIDVLNVENELKQSKLDNQRNLLIIVGIAILLATILIYQWFKNQKTKQELQQASLQHKLLQTQLNPHFLFHSLNTVQSYIFQNKKEESANYLVNYSNLMRSILESSDLDFIPVKEDANAMKQYIALQKESLQQNCDFSISVDDSIETCKIPPMFVQPFLENAIMHGIKHVENGKVRLSYKDEKDSILVTINDNGKGLEKNKTNNKLHRSMSSDIINERVKNLKQIHKFTIAISTKSTDEGTEVSIKLPKKI